MKDPVNAVVSVLIVAAFFTGVGFLLAGFTPVWLIVSCSLFFGWWLRAMLERAAMERSIRRLRLRGYRLGVVPIRF